MLNNVTVDFEVSGGSITKIFENIHDHLTSEPMKIPDDGIVRTVNQYWNIEQVSVSEIVDRPHGGQVVRRSLEASVRVRLVTK